MLKKVEEEEPSASETTNKQNSNSPDLDVERQDNTINNCLVEEEDLGKVKQKPPPGINASLVLMYAIFFLMFTIGWVNLNNCSISRLIPIYLIVAGFVGALAKFLSKIHNKFVYNLAIVLVVFDVVWHALGTYWVYREYQPNYDPLLGKYCNRTAYLLAFWILTFQYTLLGFFIMSSACYMLMRNDFKK